MDAAWGMLWAFLPHGDRLPGVSPPGRSSGGNHITCGGPALGAMRAVSLCCILFVKITQMPVQFQDKEKEILSLDGEMARFCKSR